MLCKGDNEEVGLLFMSGSLGELKGVVFMYCNIFVNCW